MFGWRSVVVFDGIKVFYNDNKTGKNSVLVMIPKKAVRCATKRNTLRRRAKEMFRLNVNRDKSADYLIKFNKFTNKFEESLVSFFRNV